MSAYFMPLLESGHSAFHPQSWAAPVNGMTALGIGFEAAVWLRLGALQTSRFSA
jgi:hypothetical protein